MQGMDGQLTAFFDEGMMAKLAMLDGGSGPSAGKKAATPATAKVAAKVTSTPAKQATPAPVAAAAAGKTCAGYDIKIIDNMT
jgi:hypothetical protein